jgi:hypothetical protein
MGFGCVVYCVSYSNCGDETFWSPLVLMLWADLPRKAQKKALVTAGLLRLQSIFLLGGLLLFRQPV